MSSLRIMCLVAVLAMITSCKKDKDNNSGSASLNVRLTDGPGKYDAVLIDVQKVEIHSDENGWITLDLAHPGIYNLLDFRNGMDTLLCQAVIPSGRISQMRLILGPDNSVIVNGTTKPLSTPSAEQSGLKFNISQELAPNGSYDIWIDFDAGRSIVAKGNGDYNLKPVIRAYTELTNGKIKGYVAPMVADPVIYAINDVDTFSAIPDETGYFMFCGLPEGRYKIWYDASDLTPYVDVTVPDVMVSFGTIYDAGTVTLSE